MAPLLWPALILGLGAPPAAAAPVELRFAGDGWRASEPVEIRRLLAPQLERRGFALCAPPCAASVATLVAELPNPDRLDWRIRASNEPPAEAAARASPRSGSAAVPSGPEERPMAVARRLFDALAVLRSLPLTQGAPKPQPPPEAQRDAARLLVAAGADVRGYTDGLTEVRGGAELRGWLSRRFGAALGLSAGQMFSVEDDEVGTVRSFSVGGHVALLAALRERGRGFDLNARAELGAVDRDYGTDGGLTNERDFGLVLAGGLEAGVPIDDRFSLLARAMVGAPLVESRAEAEGRIVTAARGVELSGGLAVVVRVLR